MARQVTATITFILHEDLDNGNEAYIQDMLAESFLADCLEDERAGIARYKTVKIDALDLVEVKDE